MAFALFKRHRGMGPVGSSEVQVQKKSATLAKTKLFFGTRFGQIPVILMVCHGLSWFVQSFLTKIKFRCKTRQRAVRRTVRGFRPTGTERMQTWTPFYIVQQPVPSEKSHQSISTDNNTLKYFENATTAKNHAKTIKNPSNSLTMFDHVRSFEWLEARRNFWVMRYVASMPWDLEPNMSE